MPQAFPPLAVRQGRGDLATRLHAGAHMARGPEADVDRDRRRQHAQGHPRQRLRARNALGSRRMPPLRSPCGRGASPTGRAPRQGSSTFTSPSTRRGASRTPTRSTISESRGGYPRHSRKPSGSSSTRESDSGWLRAARTPSTRPGRQSWPAIRSDRRNPTTQARLVKRPPHPIRPLLHFTINPLLHCRRHTPEILLTCFA